jgi:hypothetical protein
MLSVSPWCLLQNGLVIRIMINKMKMAMSMVGIAMMTMPMFDQVPPAFSLNFVRKI